jgi:hypothetical protein
MENQFQQVENEYFRLKGQLATGRITRAQFEAALHALLFTDAQGRYWMLGADSGRWFVHDGNQWLEQNPPTGASAAPPLNLPPAAPPPAYTPPLPAPTPAAPSPYVPPPAPAPYVAPPAVVPQKSGGCGRTLLLGCLVLVVACGLLAGGLYLGVTTGAVTTRTLLNLVGLGPARITVNNFRDDEIRVHILQLDVPDDSFPAQTTLDLDPFDVKSFSVGNAARYRATFALQADDSALGECILRVNAGDDYQFIAVPERIVVNRENSSPARGSDLVVATSALCRAP